MVPIVVSNPLAAAPLAALPIYARRLPPGTPVLPSAAALAEVTVHLAHHGPERDHAGSSDMSSTSSQISRRSPAMPGLTYRPDAASRRASDDCTGSSGPSPGRQARSRPLPATSGARATRHAQRAHRDVLLVSLLVALGARVNRPGLDVNVCHPQSFMISPSATPRRQKPPGTRRGMVVDQSPLEPSRDHPSCANHLTAQSSERGFRGSTSGFSGHRTGRLPTLRRNDLRRTRPSLARPGRGASRC